MGFEVAAIARGTGTAELAKKLGAHHYIDSAATDPAAALQALGGAKVILITASGGTTVATTFKGLRPGGVSIDVGVGPRADRDHEPGSHIRRAQGSRLADGKPGNW